MDGDDDDIVECTPGHGASKDFHFPSKPLEKYILKTNKGYTCEIHAYMAQFSYLQNFVEKYHQ